MKRKNQRGVSLLEMILVLALLSFLVLITIKYLQNRAQELQYRSFANQIHEVSEYVENYVKDNFSSLYSQAKSSSNIATVDINTVMTENSSDLIELKAKSPISNNYRLVVRIPYTTEPDEKMLQAIIYAVNDFSSIKWVEASKIARMIPNGEGGVLYATTSPLSPCVSSSNYCISSPYGTWLLEDNVGGNIVNGIAGDLSGVSGSNKALAVVNVKNISESDAYSDFLLRSEDKRNRDNNTMKTDMNINTLTGKSSILFNAEPETVTDISTGLKKETGGFTGTGLTFRKTSTDRSGNTYQQSNLTFESTRVDASGVRESPLFESRGGFRTGLKVDENDACDISVYKNVIAVDETTGNLLRCYPKENYEYGPDADGNNLIDEQFLGDWKKVDWKRSFYFLSTPKKAYSLSGESSGFEKIGETFNNFVGNTNDIKFIIMEARTAGRGDVDMRIRTSSGLLTTYPIDVSSDKNLVRQAIIPIPTNLSSGDDWINFFGNGVNIGEWSIYLIGYIK